MPIDGVGYCGVSNYQMHGIFARNRVELLGASACKVDFELVSRRLVRFRHKNHLLTGRPVNKANENLRGNKNK